MFEHFLAFSNAIVSISRLLFRLASLTCDRASTKNNYTPSSPVSREHNFEAHVGPTVCGLKTKLINGKTA
jgi:hypothetical protein